MKKALIGFAGLLIMAFVVVLFVNARKEDPAKKATTETVAAPSCCSSTTTSEACGKAPAGEMKCDAAKTEKTADMPACTGMAKEKTAAAKSCDPATCPMHAAK